MPRSRSRRRTRKQKGRGVTASKTTKTPTSWRLTGDGEIRPLRETYNGLPFFRKEHPWPLERTIAQLILENPHPNIVTIYRVGDARIDMEYLKPVHSLHASEVPQLEAAKTHLHSLGIAYLDWKLDNLGRSPDGRIKVFDFNVSALGNARPLAVGIAWRKAIAEGHTEPMNANNAIFRNFVQHSRLM